ncbi:MAG: SURF1 family protein [bacterium]|nr:SURF1 family protein [bacterium]
MTRVTFEEWRRAALTRKNIALLVAVLVGALAFLQLGSWQLDRAAIRGAAEAEITATDRMAAAPRPLAEVLQPGTTFLTDHQLQKVQARGTWGAQVVVPGRAVEGAPAVLVVTQFLLDDAAESLDTAGAPAAGGGGAGTEAAGAESTRAGTGGDGETEAADTGGASAGTGGDDGTGASSSGLWIPVLRGWIPADQVGEDPVGVAGELAPAPSGEGSVVGYLSSSENSATGNHPEGAVGAISTAELANEWGGRTYTGFLVAEAADDPDLQTMPPPSYERERGMNLQNLFYAIEWFIFGGFALVMWVFWVRGDAVRAKEAAIMAEARGGRGEAGAVAGAGAE